LLNYIEIPNQSRSVEDNYRKSPIFFAYYSTILRDYLEGLII